MTEEVELRGLDTVRVKRGTVLGKIRENRDEHRRIYEEAMDGWKKSVIEELERMHADALAGRNFRTYVSIEQPRDHTDDYDTVIEMLSFSLDEELELSSQEFANYVLDKWGWQPAFLANASSWSPLAAEKLKA